MDNDANKICCKYVHETWPSSYGKVPVSYSKYMYRNVTFCSPSARWKPLLLLERTVHRCKAPHGCELQCTGIISRACNTVYWLFAPYCYTSMWYSGYKTNHRYCTTEAYVEYSLQIGNYGKRYRTFLHGFRTSYTALVSMNKMLWFFIAKHGYCTPMWRNWVPLIAVRRFTVLKPSALVNCRGREQGWWIV